MHHITKHPSRLLFSTEATASDWETVRHRDTEGGREKRRKVRETEGSETPSESRTQTERKKKKKSYTQTRTTAVITRQENKNHLYETT